jgi:hypothetical protein
MTSCREIRQALGVYVLGAIDPAERAQVDEHLASCPDCREELASLAGLPAMLRKVPMVEAERLAAPDAELDVPAVPSEEMLESLVTRTNNVRRIHRWRGLVAAAAVVVLALGGGVVVGHALQSSPSISSIAHWRMVSHTDPVTGADLTVKYRQMTWGTEMQIHVSGLKPGSVCNFLVTDKGGGSWPAGGWLLAAEHGATWYPASTWFGEKDLKGFSLTVGGKVVASVRAD